MIPSTSPTNPIIIEKIATFFIVVIVPSFNYLTYLICLNYVYNSLAYKIVITSAIIAFFTLPFYIFIRCKSVSLLVLS